MPVPPVHISSPKPTSATLFNSQSKAGNRSHLPRSGKLSHPQMSLSEEIEDVGYKSQYTVAHQLLMHNELSGKPLTRRRAINKVQSSAHRGYSPTIASPLRQSCWSQDSVPTPLESDSGSCEDETRGANCLEDENIAPSTASRSLPRMTSLSRDIRSYSEAMPVEAAASSALRRSIRELSEDTQPDYGYRCYAPGRVQPPIGSRRSQDLQAQNYVSQDYTAYCAAPITRPSSPSSLSQRYALPALPRPPIGSDRWPIDATHDTNQSSLSEQHAQLCLNSQKREEHHSGSGRTFVLSGRPSRQSFKPTEVEIGNRRSE